MLGNEKGDASDKATPENMLQSGAYQKSASESTAELQLGTLLLALQGPMTRGQRATGWQVFEALLSARYGEGSV